MGAEIPPGPPREPGRSRLPGREHVVQHGRALIEIAIVSGFGILASAGFQVVASRGLGPGGFGLLAAFLALINIAAIGSAALRNSVAVAVAQAPTASSGNRRLDSTLIEAIVLGSVFAVGLLVLSPWLASSLQSNSIALLLAAGTILPYFLFARSLGLLQGRGDSRSVVWWSTGAQLAQLALAVIAISLGYGVVGILAIFLITIVVATVGSAYQTRDLSVDPATKPFSVDSMIVVLLTISFAWLTNVDVILVRQGTTELVAGSYAAAAVLVKTTLILPATLSLYLLPRFVSNRANSRMTRLGVNLTLGVTLLSGLVIFGVLALAGGPIVYLLFGEDYGLTIELLPWLALMWIPWAMTQAILVRITSIASRWGLLVLIVAAGAQWIGSVWVLPNLTAMIALNGSIGVLSLLCLFVVHQRAARRQPPGIEDAPSVAIQDPRD